MVFQDPYASMNPRWRVAKIVAEPIRAFNPRCPFANERCRAEVPALAEGVACHGFQEGRL